MSNRWFRFVIALAAIAAAAAAGYRIFEYEQQIAQVSVGAREAGQATSRAIVAAADLRGAMNAYVAVGQGHDFWFSRADMLFNNVRAATLELQRHGDPDNKSNSDEAAPLTDALDTIDRLAAADKRARSYVSNGQLLLAGEAIFTDARDQFDTLRLALARAADEAALQADQAVAQLRQDQAMLALGAAGVLALAVLLLVPTGRIEAPAVVPPATRPASGTEEYRVVSRVPLKPPDPVKASPAAEFATANAPVRSASAAPAAAAVSPVSEKKKKDAAPLVRLGDAASVCTDLGRLSQSNEMAGLLRRAAEVLSASGVIVWMATENRDELYPAAFAGYDDRLFSRIGSIRRDAANLTAAAFRDGAARTSPRAGSTSAALAAPLLTAQGPVGVLSAEIREAALVDGDRLAVATIFAAQLATLLSAVSVPAEVVSEPQARNG